MTVRIAYAPMQPICHRLPLADKFTYNPARPARWLQKACFWVLRKLKCEAAIEKIEYHTVEVDTAKVLDQVMDQMNHVFRTTGYHPTCVLMGRKQFHEVVSDPCVERYTYLSFDMHVERRHHQLLGMRVVIVPWMDGIIVLPPKDN